MHHQSLRQSWDTWTAFVISLKREARTFGPRVSYIGLQHTFGGGILQACKNDSTSVQFIMYIKDCEVRSEEKGIVWNLDTNIELFT